MRKSLLALAVVACGCAQEKPVDNPLAAGESIVAIYQEDAGGAAAQRQALSVAGLPVGLDDGKSFYLAINKKELGQKWFLSAYLKQLYPYGVANGAAQSLGTRVVTFRVQNDKLYVFDADDRKKESETVDPTVIVEAYPLVTYLPFALLPGAQDYVLFDPSAGLNKFGVVSDAFALSYPIGQNQMFPNPPTPDRFAVELSFLRHFRPIGDGITFEQIFTGYREQASPDGPNGFDENPFRASGTLGIALRRYSEGAGFTKLPYQYPYYFGAQPQWVPNTGNGYWLTAKWNIHPGMKPIKWVISNQVAALAQDPRYAGFDILGSVKQAIEGWNAVFGFQVLTAEVATGDVSYEDDDVNYLIYDPSPRVQYAFANWRTNPNTGEIRGASVYFNSIWLAYLGYLDPTPPATTNTSGSTALTWTSMPQHPLCTYPLPKHAANSPKLTGRRGEKFLTHILMHEIGHTLGLTHNFEGSLVPPSTSVMDYLGDEESIAMDHPGSYDTAAIKLLYGLSTALPTDPFCNDGSLTVNPDCAQFDGTANPLVQYWGPWYQGTVAGALQNHYKPSLAPLDYVLNYVRAGVDPLAAWNLIQQPLRGPFADEQMAAVADYVQGAAFEHAYLFPAAQRGLFTADPPAFGPFIVQARADLQTALVDGLHHSFGTRRVAVDVLKKMQTFDAYDVLVGARASIAADRKTLTGPGAELTDDLLARIDDAIEPYFIK